MTELKVPTVRIGRFTVLDQGNGQEGTQQKPKWQEAIEERQASAAIPTATPQTPGRRSADIGHSATTPTDPKLV